MSGSRKGWKESACIRYTSGYKYQLLPPLLVRLPVELWPNRDVKLRYIEIYTDGWMRLLEGYAWNGATGALDTSAFMRPSALHDAIYQLMRLGIVPRGLRRSGDKFMLRKCKEDGMLLPRRLWVSAALALFGEKATMPESKRKVHVAPRKCRH